MMRSTLPLILFSLTLVLWPPFWTDAAEREARTTLTDETVRFTISSKPYVVLQRGDVRAVIVNNEAVDDEILPGHRAGYSGVASLTHRRQAKNLFVPAYAGLNFEHIHDGTVQHRDVLFEPRRVPMELRVVDAFTVELYQQPTPHWGLESCSRYKMLPDGTLEMTLECVPRRQTFRNDYVGLFWASYIHQPASLDIHFKGRAASQPDGSQWLRGVTPAHGKLSTHVGINDGRTFSHDVDFPLTLVFNRSMHRFTEPWYFGVSHGMAFVQMFREEDRTRHSQSPSGGGMGNPAWDFQYFIPAYRVGQVSRMVMRAAYLPFQSAEQIERDTAVHRRALNSQD